MADPVRRLGKYEILGAIGRGGFATVYRARDTVLEREVALKVLAPHLIWDPDFVARFKQEARVAAHLRHPNIVAIYEIDEVESQLFIAMELVTAGSLWEYLQAQGPLSVVATAELLAPIADALDEAHSQGLVHRDIKPANILLEKTRTGAMRPLLTDFGLVKALAQHSELTRTGAILGTVEYMAPEQIDYERADEVGPATDIYALGIVVYHILTGQVPFSGSSAQVMYAHMHKPPPAPSAIRADLPAAVSSCILTALAKQPGDRFATATDFIQTLAAAGHPLPATAPVTQLSVPPAPTTPSPRRDDAGSQPQTPNLTAEPPALAQAAVQPPTPTSPSAGADGEVDATPETLEAPAIASRLAAQFRAPSSQLLSPSERPRFIGALLVASMIGAALGWPLATWIAGPLTDWRWEAPLGGLVIGVVMAAWQASKLTRMVPNRMAWVVATGIGIMLSFILLKDVDLANIPRFFLILLLTVGLLQALALWRGLHPSWAIGWAPYLAAGGLLGLKLAWRALGATDGEEVKYFFGYVAGEAMFGGLSNLIGWERTNSLFTYLGWLIRGGIFGAVVGAAQGAYLALAHGRRA